MITEKYEIFNMQTNQQLKVSTKKKIVYVVSQTHQSQHYVTNDNQNPPWLITCSTYSKNTVTDILLNNSAVTSVDIQKQKKTERNG